MTPLEIVGHLGNVCFFSRWVVQWIASERAKESRAPRSFFWLSLSGSALLFAYTMARGEHILLAGYAANFLFYTRNLVLMHRPGSSRGPSPYLVLVAAIALLLAVLASGAAFGRNEASSTGWLVCGIAGQVMFGGRFTVQWWFSELRGRSHFPALFWWFSLAGNALLLAYTLHVGDAVWIVGQATAWIVPIRNLFLERRRSEHAADVDHAGRISSPQEPSACQRQADA